ncbi:DUF6519 domain-containing protein [Dyella silvatica]|uniref:DUF6519 domain-containing protein n=1 Tax=Dyella silvatica TaxID=2992128 RepID=UPI0022593457|nr:DUF6519 domain-containing protein [Dyella silvatica]
MAGDYSRIADGLHKHYAEVLMQQGRVHLDSDWNGMAWLHARRWETQAADTFGPVAVPALTTPNGFKITATGAGTDLAIGAGRCYIDGIQAELFAGETVNGQAVTYLNQPFYPNPPAIAGNGLVYLDVWKREVSYIEDPGLLDIALGGVDTTTRMQTVWQVKLLPSTAAGGATLSCSTDLSGLLPPSAGQISTQAVAPVTPTDPCILPDQGGYRGIENRLYRVEIHTAGNLAAARWKWSRENASIVSRVTGISNAVSSCKLSVDRIGRDSVLRFNANDWVEITDDATELAGLPGTMAQVVGPPDETTLSITLDRALPASFNAADPNRHTRIIRWDQSQGVDSNGLLPISAGWMDLEDGVQVTLALDASIVNGQFNTADFWCFAARTADASVQTLSQTPPLGIRHHYAVLASYATSGGTVSINSDCRTLWPPANPSETGCGCTVCVDAKDHNAGTATIAMAVEQIRPTGGRICLGPGVFVLGATLLLQGLAAVTLSGQGPASVLLFAGDGPALQLDTDFGLRIEDLSVLAIATATSTGTAAAGATVGTPAVTPVVMGIQVINSAEVAIERCGIMAVSAAQANNAGAAAPAPAPAAAAPAPVNGIATELEYYAAPIYTASLANLFTPGGIAIAIDGFVLETSIRDNVLIADVGLGKASLLAGINTPTGGGLVNGAMQTTRDVLIAGDLDVLDNWMPCAMAAIAIIDINSDVALSAFLLETSLSANRIMACQTAGIGIEGIAMPGAAIRSERNHIDVQGGGIYCGTDGLIIADNVVTQADYSTSSSAIRSGYVTAQAAIHVGPIPGGKLPITEAHISRNHINAFAGAGVQITGNVLVSSVIDNSITEVTRVGIVVAGSGTPAEAIIRGNEVLAVLAPVSTGTSVVNVASSKVKLGDFAKEYVKPAGVQVTTVGSYLIGIEVVGVPTAMLQNNTVGLIGSLSTQPVSAAGIRLQRVQTATVSGNDISDIGMPGSLDQTCYGIIAVANFAQLAVSGNTVRQNSTDTTQSGSFSAIAVNDIEKGGEMLIAEGNMLTGNSVIPLVDIGQGGHCGFTGNVCQQTGTPDTANPVVQIACDTAIAGNNRIVSSSIQTGLAITVTTVSIDKQEPAATVLGNIVSRRITLNNDMLKAPWEPLNLLA